MCHISIYNNFIGYSPRSSSAGAFFLAKIHQSFVKLSPNRVTDEDGRLHISNCVLTQEEVSPYLGSEITGWEDLGLDSSKVYGVYRPFDEIEKAAPTFCNLQLLDEHIPTTPENPRTDITVGTVGTDCVAQAPQLLGTITVWVKDAIDQILLADSSPDNGKKDLSLGYYYDLVPETGIFEGKKYDFKMVNIRGNHVALVPEGRVQNAMIADSKTKFHEGKMKADKIQETSFAKDAIYKIKYIGKDGEVDKAKVAKMVLDMCKDEDFEGKEDDLLKKLEEVVGSLGAAQSKEKAAAADEDKDDDKEEKSKAADEDKDSDKDDDKKSAQDEDKDEDDKEKSKAADEDKDDDKEDKKAMADAINKQVQKILKEHKSVEALCSRAIGNISASFASDASAEEMLDAALEASGFSSQGKSYNEKKLQLETIATLNKKSNVNVAMDANFEQQKTTAFQYKSVFEGVNK